MQMIAAIPNGVCVECFEPARDPIWAGLIANRPNPKNGIIPIPQGPGFGLELNWDMVKRYRVNENPACGSPMRKRLRGAVAPGRSARLRIAVHRSPG